MAEPPTADQPESERQALISRPHKRGGRRKGAGRPAWKPTDRDREQIGLMAACGIPDELIAVVLGVHDDTLRKHCAAELQAAGVEVKARVGGFIVASILGLDGFPGRLKDDRARATLAIFFAKTRMGWRETIAAEHSGPNGGPIPISAASAELTAELDRIAERVAGREAGPLIEG